VRLSWNRQDNRRKKKTIIRSPDKRIACNYVKSSRLCGRGKRKREINARLAAILRQENRSISLRSITDFHQRPTECPKNRISTAEQILLAGSDSRSRSLRVPILPSVRLMRRRSPGGDLAPSKDSQSEVPIEWRRLPILDRFCRDVSVGISSWRAARVIRPAVVIRP